MKKLYQVIFQDEYDNLYELGWFKELDDAIEPINQEISGIYGAEDKYKLKKGDLKEYQSTFSSCFDLQLGAFFAEDDVDSFDDFQSASIRGFIHEFEDEQYNEAVELLVKTNKNEPNLIDKLNYDTLINLINKKQNNAILEYLNDNEEKAIYELLDSLIEITKEKQKNKIIIDCKKCNIDEEKIKPYEYWEELKESYIKVEEIPYIPEEKIINKVANDKIKATQKRYNFLISEKEKMLFLGYAIYQWDVIEYYSYEEGQKLVGFLYNCYKNKRKIISEILIRNKTDFDC